MSKLSKKKRREKRRQGDLVDRVVCEYDVNLFLELHKNTTHRRFEVFIHKGITCVNCGRRATKAVYHFDRGDGSGGLHLDLYSDDVMMNVDHIRPKSKGGPDTLENKQPMCEPCNSKKADTYELSRM